MLGTKETKEMLGFVLGLGNALGASMVDGKVTIGDLHNFVGPLLSSGDAFNGADQIPSELADLDAAEQADMLTFAETEFGVPEHAVNDVVEGAFDVLNELFTFVRKVKAALPVAAAPAK